eukprot:XP_001700594.1 predicted protein [Chlamydomonas reinhardtii]
MRCSVLVATLLAATTLWAAPALAQNEATQPLYQLHGSGTSNPAPIIWRGLVLPPCTLARIMRGDITVWNHPDILANNTHLPDLATVTAPIRVVHRNPGSSSTYAITHYFNKACPSQWSAVAGSPATKTADVGSSRTVGVTTEWPADAAGRWQTVLNSQAGCCSCS